MRIHRMFIVLVSGLLLLGSARMGAGKSINIQREPLPAEVLGRVDGMVLRKGEFRAWLTLKGVALGLKTPEDRESLLVDFAVERELAAEARRKGLDRSKEFQSKSELYDIRNLPDLYFNREFFDKTVLEEEDYAHLYRELVDVAEIRIARLDNETAARELLAAIRNGESFEPLIQEPSGGVSARSGGIIPEIRRNDIRFTPAELEMIFTAPFGDVSGPFLSNLGDYTLIQVISRKTVEDQKEEIRRNRGPELKQAKARRAYGERLNDEFSRTEIEINEAYFSGEAEKQRKPYLAWVKGKYIYPGDVSSPHGGVEKDLGNYRRALDKMIRDVIVVDLAVRAGVADTPEYRLRKDAFETNELASMVLFRGFSDSRASITRKEIETYYKAYYLPDAYAIWTVINRDSKKVNAARRERLEKRERGEIAAKYSEDLSRMSGGIIGYFPLPAYHPGVKEKILSLKIGELSEMFELDGKYHIVELMDHKVVTVPPLDDIRDKVRESLLLQKRADWVVKKRSAVSQSISLIIDPAKINGME